MSQGKILAMLLIGLTFSFVGRSSYTSGACTRRSKRENLTSNCFFTMDLIGSFSSLFFGFDFGFDFDSISPLRRRTARDDFDIGATL